MSRLLSCKPVAKCHMCQKFDDFQLVKKCDLCKNDFCRKCSLNFTQHISTCWNIDKFPYLNQKIKNIIMTLLLSLKRLNIDRTMVPKYMRYMIIDHIVISNI